jgi:RNA polymerase sigma factor (sigma-70 family)
MSSRRAHGDGASFSALYEQHHQELFRYCRSIVRHEQDAQDVLQNTMVKAFRALQGEDRELDIRPWLFRIAHNEAISLLRRRRETHEVPDLAELGGGMDERLIEREDLRALQADLADLSETQRSALVLRELNGLGHAEIALVLDSSPQSVKQSIYEARSALLESREGREMACEAIRRTLSDADGRTLRGRRLRAHLRSCRGCRQFKADLVQRPRDLAAMAPPLPAAASAALLHHLLAGSGKATGGTFAGAGSGVSGVAGVLGTKAAITAAILATAAGGTAIVTHPFTHHAGTGAGHSGTGAHGAGSALAPAVSNAGQPGGPAATTLATSGHGVANSAAVSRATSSPGGPIALSGQVGASGQTSSSAPAHGKAGVTVTSGQAGGHAHAPSASAGHRAHGGAGHRSHSGTGHRAGGNSSHHPSGHQGGHGGSSAGGHGNSGAGGSAPAQPAPSGGGSGHAPSRRHDGSGPRAPSLPKLPAVPKLPY